MSDDVVVDPVVDPVKDDVDMLCILKIPYYRMTSNLRLTLSPRF